MESQSVLLQVEFYLSDQNLPTDNFLMKLVRRDPEGWGQSSLSNLRVLSRGLILTNDLAVASRLAVLVASLFIKTSALSATD